GVPSPLGLQLRIVPQSPSPDVRAVGMINIRALGANGNVLRQLAVETWMYVNATGEILGYDRQALSIDPTGSCARTWSGGTAIPAPQFPKDCGCPLGFTYNYPNGKCETEGYALHDPAVRTRGAGGGMQSNHGIAWCV